MLVPQDLHFLTAPPRLILYPHYSSTALLFHCPSSPKFLPMLLTQPSIHPSHLFHPPPSLLTSFPLLHPCGFFNKSFLPHPRSHICRINHIVHVDQQLNYSNIRVLRNVDNLHHALICRTGICASSGSEIGEAIYLSECWRQTNRGINTQQMVKDYEAKEFELKSHSSIFTCSDQQSTWQQSLNKAVPAFLQYCEATLNSD